MEKSQEEAVQIVYATSFRDRLLEGKCDIEVVVDLEAGTATGILSMRQVLRSGPAFSISLDNLKAIAKTIKATKTNAFLLETLVPDATDHQLNWSCGGASMIVVQPKGSQARFTLSIGNYHREGVLSELNTKDIDTAVDKIKTRIEEVMTKVNKRKQ